MKSRKELKILLIEDNPGDARLFLEMLQDAPQMDFKVECADRLQTALHLLGVEPFDVVVTDLNLPDSAGLETFMEVAQAAPNTAIVVLTGVRDWETGKVAVDEGAQDYLVKDDISSSLLTRTIVYSWQRKQLERELAWAKARLEHLVNTSPGAIYSCRIDETDGGLAFTPEYFSERIKTFCGDEPASLFGDAEWWAKRIDPRDADHVSAELHSLFKNDFRAFEYRFVSASGEYRWVEDRMALVRDQSGKPTEIVGTLADITERKRLAEMEKQFAASEATAVEAARHAEELKSIIDVASHELRHPLSIIKGYSTILIEREEKLDEQTRRNALQKIDRAADRLTQQIGKLLDASRVEDGRIALDLKEVDAASLVRCAFEEIRAEGGDVDFNMDGPRRSLSLRCVPEWVKDILKILFDNASKYSLPGGGVDVEWEQAADELVFRVSDRGPGVPEKDRELVFERFYQVEPVKHHSLPGMGLGLYIAKSYVEAQGGWIRCEEREGGGSTFIFGLPCPGGT